MNFCFWCSCQGKSFQQFKFLHKKRKTALCTQKNVKLFVGLFQQSEKHSSLLLVFVENDGDEKLKASGVITLLQFEIWLIREIPTVFRHAGMRRQE